MRLLTALLVLCLALPVHSQLGWVAEHPGTIVYDLDLSKVQQHELEITVTFPAVPMGVFYVRMPQFSPGRYAQHNFARNVYDLRALGANGQPVSVERTEPNAWAITGHGGKVTLSYTLFANGGDGTYSGIDERKLHLNMPATFLYGEKLNDRPVMLRLPVDQRSEWEVATQLVDLGSRRFAAPNYYYFYDSPTLVGTMMRDEFTVASGERVDTIEVVVMSEDSREVFSDYVAWVERVVRAQQEVFGELPAYDYGRYVFLCSYNPWIGGDGMEHRNSTVCSAPIGLEGNQQRLIGTVSHEFFHCWNVERIRPASLEPFQFDHVNMSGELWFAEGFTSYYDDLALVRAGILDPAEYASGLAGQLNYVVQSPGREFRGPAEMSQLAPFVDAATANDPDNYANTFVSYYTYGATIGLALDLELRQRGTQLDEVMRLMWQRYGKPEIPYHIRDIQLAVGKVAADSAWAASWFDRHIYGSDLPDYGELLAPYGIDVRQARPDSAGFYGLRLREDAGRLIVSGPVYEHSPLFAAGINPGTTILALDGKEIATQAEWDAAVGELQIGETYTITFEQLGRQTTGWFEAAASPAFRSGLREGAEAEAVARRAEWLGR
ncbi:putative metalloprotease with PDZ domain [Neolewinella xylanilytica]|uniref:Putative metalloprotease with PDZ domain n=2 Tax=Neolewinella xylanilytica TaxID=1514080 RepID=A0A2S6I467_9BACT|nr:putative metalloprotease with PDZ domain [Neolewinella xylanilytica]